MRFSSPTNHHSRHGFTLVEVVVIAPILILTLGGFILALVTMVSDALVSRDTNNLVYETQTALDRIEQDARISLEFPTTTGALTSPQGSNNNFTGTSAFTAPAANILLLSTMSTTTNPISADREVVYYAQPNACGANQSYNNPHKTTVVYYVYNKNLYRRTLVAPFTLTAGATMVCDQPWQQNSCSPGQTATQCQTQDALIMGNVNAFTVEYYGAPNCDSSTCSQVSPAAASTIVVTVDAKRDSAGQPITNKSVLRATRLNTSD